jgi:hypothetical protein
VRQPAKKQAEDQHGKKRLQNGPGRANSGLFISNFDVAPDEEIKQLAVFPKFIDGQNPPTAGRSDSRDGELGLGLPGLISGGAKRIQCDPLELSDLIRFTSSCSIRPIN